MDQTGLTGFFGFGFFPQDRTYFKDIRILQPATRYIFGANGEKLMREKIKALSSEATASAMIIGCLPPGVITLITLASPSYMAVMFNDPRGHMMLLGGGIWMGFGIFVMRRMINFKY